MPARRDKSFPQPPLVAVTTSDLREAKSVTPTRGGEPPQREIALSLEYLQAVEAAGGIPVLVPPLRESAVEPLLNRCSGLLLSGGLDLHPDAYGQAPHPELGPTDRAIDGFELALARAADARRMPILAICRGLQLLNVARGGTLHQHLADVTGDRRRRQTEAWSQATHWVSLASDSRLAEVLGRRRTKVNSFHHQAVNELGRALEPTAWATDGTIEGLEAADRDFVVGVQWHVESLVRRPAHASVFEAFVHAATRYERSAAAVSQAP